MKLYVRDGKLRAESLFKFAFVGIALGEALIFGPLFLLAFGALSFSTEFPSQMFPLYMMPVILPFIFVMHGLMFGGMIVLGLWVYSRFGKLEVVNEP